MKKKSKKLFTLGLLAVGFLAANWALAQGFGTNEVNTGLAGSLSSADPRLLIGRIINISLGFLGVIAVGLIIYAGFIWMTSGGDDEKVATAKKIIKNGVIGLAIILSSWAIATFVLNMLGGGINPGGGVVCEDGNTRNCGGCGTMTCSGNSWGTCFGDTNCSAITPPKSCDGNLLTPTCEATEGICASTDYCDPTDCGCKPKAGLGASCNLDSSHTTCSPDNNRCAEYLTCNTETCVCSGPPIITGISPLGGFCANNVNKSCNDDSECPSSTCDLKTPNGTSNNFITIFGKNFGEYSATSSKVIFAGAGNVAVKNGNDYTATNYSCVMSQSGNTTASCSNAYWDYQISVPQSGSYQFWIETTNYNSSPYGDLSVFAPPSGGENVCPASGVQHHINIYLDGALQGSFCSQAVSPNETKQLATINMSSVSAGSHTVKVTWDNDWTYNPDGVWGTPDDADSNLKIYRLGLVSTSASLGRQPKELNSDCIDSWRDDQIIIAVPNGLTAGTGQIAVVNKDNLTDTTGDANGPLVPDFQGNIIVRPGLCQLSPDNGGLSSGVGYSGINLYTGQAFFGNYKNNVAALESDFNNPAGLNGTSTVPNIKSGSSGSFVETNIGGYKKSNYLLFKKNPEQNEGPFIYSFTPTSGNIGQYVTIRGAGFGNARGASKVFFDGTEASYDFPAVCLNSVWKDNQIIVKVPSGLSDGDKIIEIKLDKETIDTQKLNPSYFLASSTLALNPSLCKIDPVSGPVGTPVSLWGEYFGTVNSGGSVKFNENKNATGTIQKINEANLIQTSVPVDSTGPAITGPVKVIRASESGNELNFNVGSCVDNSDCGGSQVCCPSNTYMNGRCATSTPDCLINIPTSVFEWSFKTGFATDTPETHLDSCGGLAKYYGACQTGASCPNVPGTCSPYGGGLLQSVGTCKNDCSDILGCGLLSPNNCSYNASVNKCIKNGTGANCDLAQNLTYTVKSITASTTEICNTDKHWEINISTSCPDNTTGSNWVKSTGNKCVDLNSTCSICSADFSCQNISGNGRCVSAPVCSTGSVCDVSNKCVITDKASCSCCCPISPDPVIQAKNNQQNCCSFTNKVTGQTGQLTCEGSCGSETGKPNPTLGKCGGCKNAGDTTEERDAACNCSGHGSQFCDVSNPLFANGVCADCSDLNVKQDCNDHSSVCCQDSKKTATTTDDICRGGNGRAITASTTLPSFGYCAYYNCSVANPTQCASTTPVVGSVGSYSSTSTCVTGCAKEQSCTDLTSLGDCRKNSSCCFNPAMTVCTSGKAITDYVTDSSHYGFCLPPAGLGLSCASATSTACNSNLCVFDKASCLLSTGALSTGSLSDCGTCCCQPGATTTINNTVLTCLANKGNCTGGSRGLFCGCTKDDECGAATTGCGSDTCCKARPNIVSTSPAHLDDKVCRNATIKVNFDQTMDVASFNNNVLLLEERNYADGVCPTGTFVAKGDSLADLLAQKNKNWWQNLIDRLFFTLAKLGNNFFGSALAGVPDPTKLYCSAPGTVYGESNGGKTSLLFTPKKILNPATNYYLVIKGDESLNSKTGVLNLEEVGFNGLGYKDPVTGAYVENPPITFNNHKYINSQIIMFKTLPAIGAMSGICAIDSVTVNPASYLFNTTSNALTLDEDDSDANNKNFDTVADSDKIFTASAYSTDGQILQPVTGYFWNWNFLINNSNIATNSTVPNLPSNKTFVKAVEGVTDGETKVKAMINMDGISDNINKFGDKFNNSGSIYVFICNNPWPPVDANGLWSPWVDKITSSANDYNYKFYYCRDSGESGTLDDLPAINSTPVTMGTNSLVCSSDHSDCTAIGSGNPCGPFNSDGGQDGICIWDILKESYFLRAPILTGSIITNVSDQGTGGAVKVNWTPSTSSDVYSYKIYYLPSGKNAMMFKEVKKGECTATACSTDITGLTNNSSYIFQVSVISNNKAESSLSPEVSATPTDSTRPATPVGFQAAVIGNSTLKFSWTANTDDTAFYRLFHGTVSGSYGESFDSAPSSTSLSFPLDQFSSGDNYFALSALDSYKNESSNKSGELNYKNNIPNLVSIKGLSYYPLNTEHWWYQAPNLTAATVNRECLVKLNVIVTATSTTAVCNNVYVTGTSTRWFAGSIAGGIASRYCSTAQCALSVQPNSCSDPSGTWADRCYLHD